MQYRAPFRSRFHRAALGAFHKHNGNLLEAIPNVITRDYCLRVEITLATT